MQFKNVRLKAAVEAKISKLMEGKYYTLLVVIK